MNTRLIAQFTLIFLTTQALGLFAGNYLIEQQIHATLVNDNPEDVANSIGLIIWILVSTALLLAIMRYAPDWLLTILLKALESMATFATAIIVVLPLEINDGFAYAFALSLVALRILFAKNLILRNLTSAVSAAGAGALIGASLGNIPIAVFLLLLAAYDLIAVFKTKHMVELAKGITKKNLSFTFALPTKEHQFELGTGDIVVPLAFAVSVLAASKSLPLPYNMVPPFAILFASLVSL